VPTGVVELKQDALFLAGANRLSEIGKYGFEHLLANHVGDVPHGPTRCRLNEAGNVQPLEPMVTDRNRAFSDRCSDAARDRLQADPILIGGPNLDLCARMLAPFLGGGPLEFF